jgi:hypothetical protein
LFNEYCLPQFNQEVGGQLVLCGFWRKLLNIPYILLINILTLALFRLYVKRDTTYWFSSFMIVVGSFVFVSVIFEIEKFAVYMSCFKTLNPVHFAQYTYMFYVFLKITLIISANSINWLAFVIEVQSVCCEEGTKIFYVI